MIYIGGYCPATAIAVLIAGLETDLNLKPPCSASNKVEAILRKSSVGTYLVLMNHSPSPETVANLRPATDLITAKPISNLLQIEGLGVAVLRFI